MALTSTTKTELYQFFAIAFNAAPGVTYMSQLADAVNAGMTVKQVVNVFTTKSQFLSTYPNFFTNEQFANKLVTNVVENSASAEAKAAAVADITAALNAGWSRGDVIYQVFSNLANKSFADETWGNTAKQMANQVAYAEYYTETLMGDTETLSTLRGVIADVTYESATTTTAMQQALVPIAAGAMASALTSGVDSISGTYGAESLAATTSTLGNSDSINMGDGSDTLSITITGSGESYAPTVTSADRIIIESGVTSGTTTLDFSDITGTTRVDYKGGVNAAAALLSLNDLQAIPTLVLNADSLTSVTVDFDSSVALTRSNDTLAVTLTNAAASGLTLTLTDNADSVNNLENLTVSVAEAATLTVTEGSTTSAVGLSKLTLTGGYAVSLTANSVETIDASAMTAALSFTSGRADSVGVAVTGTRDADNLAGAANANDTLTGGLGADSLSGNSGNDSLVGGDGNDKLYGGAGNDLLFGDGGADSIQAGAGNDYVSGGLGNDTIDFVSDSATFSANETVIGGGGVDSMIISSTSLADSVFANVSDMDSLTLTSGGGAYGATIAAAFEATGISEITATDQAVTLNASAIVKALTVTTGSGDDAITSGSGSDSIVTGSGTDVVDAGAGDDTVSLGSALTSGDSVLGGSGTDLVQTSDQLVADADLANIKVENLTFSDTVDATFGSAAQAAGIRTLTLSAFGDTLTVSADSVGLTINLGAGADTLISSATAGENVSGAAGADSISAGSGNDTVDGGADNDTIQGNNGSDSLLGGAGDDVISGGSGNDYVDGGAGADSITDSAGNDSLLGGADNDSISILSGDDSVDGGTGQDTFQISALELTSNDSISGGADSADALTFTAAGGAVIDSQFTNVSGVETLNLTSGITTITLGAEAEEAGIKAITAADSVSYLDASAYQATGLTITTTSSTQAAVIFTGAGSDSVVISSTGAETINVGEGNNTVSGGSGATTLTAGSGADSLVTGAGADVITAGGGNDTITSASGGDTVYGGEGDNLITLSTTGTDHNVVTTGSGNDTIVTGEGLDNVTSGDGADSVNLGLGDGDVASLGDGNDTVIVSDITTGDTISGGAGVNTLRLDGGPVVDSNLGHVTFIDVLALGNSANSITLGANALAAGVDTVTMGTGGDSVVVTTAFTSALVINGSTGADTLQVADSVLSSMTFAGSTGADVLQVVGAATVLGDAAFANISSVATLSFENTAGAAVTLGANAQAAGISTVVTGSNADTINASSYTVGLNITSGAGDTITTGAGADTITLSSTAANVSTGDGNDKVTGDAGADTISSGAGNDTIDAGAGANQISIGSGFDSVLGGSDNDIVKVDVTELSNVDIIKFGDGVADTLEFTTAGTVTDAQFRQVTGLDAITLANGGNTVTLDVLALASLGAASITITGGTGADIITATGLGAATVTASLGAGNDSISTGTGPDTIDTGTGQDTVVTGSGADSILSNADSVGDNLSSGDDNDVITAGSGNDTIDAGAGNDIVTAGNGNNSVIGGTGNDAITSGTGNDTIDAGAGSDTIDSGAGNDAITLADYSSADTVQGGTGTDTVTITATATVAGSRLLGVESLVLNGSGADSVLLISGDTISSITSDLGNETIDGIASNLALNISSGAGADSILGSLQADTISGGSGNDIISGSGGADVFDLGTGVDSVLGDSGAEKFITSELTVADTIAASSGADTIELSMGGTLADSIFTYVTTDHTSDVLSLTGTAVSLTASTYVNAAFNSIVASAGNDSIDVSGAATVTSVTGGAGDDVITLSGANSFASGGTGNDTILGGAGADTLNGGISGGDGADSLSGGAGADNMAGDAGNDTILGGSGADTLNGGAGDDSIDGGTEADTIYGGDGNDILLGGTGADSIFGDAGNDTITGGRGNDTLTGGTGNDTFVFTYDLAGDTVTVVDFDHVSQADKIDITDIVNRLPAGAPSSATITEITTDFTGGGALNTATTLVTFYDNGTDTFVYIDVDGNGVWQSTTDLTIKLVGVTGTTEKPVNGDFIKP